MGIGKVERVVQLVWNSWGVAQRAQLDYDACTTSREDPNASLNCSGSVLERARIGQHTE